MRLLVTGSRGFLGAHLCAFLRQKHPEAKLFRLSHNPSPGTIACELEDIEETREVLLRLKPTHIFHLAGRAGRASWDEFWNANIDATFGLLEAVASLPDASKIRLVIAGSAGEYGAPHRKGPISESDALDAVTEYGTVKRAQYWLASSYRHRGLKIIWARIFNVFGPGMPEGLALGSFARQIARSERGEQDAIKVGNLSAKRDYIDVRDVARALDALARRGMPGEAYNISSGRSWAMSELLRRMIAFSNRPIRVVQEASRVKRGEVRDVYGSHRKISTLTGWRPKFKLEDSLRDTLQWHRNLA